MSGDTRESLVARVRGALRLVIDPELGYNIVDLGLVYDVSVTDDRTALVTMTTTTRGCPATHYLQAGATQAIESLEGIQDVDVELTWDPPWSPKMMAPEAKAHFGIADDGG